VIDPELSAMQFIADAMHPLSAAVQQRVARWSMPGGRPDRPRAPQSAPAPACRPVGQEPLLSPRQHQGQPAQEGPGPPRPPAGSGCGMSLYLLGLLIVVLSVLVVFGIFWLGHRLSLPGEEKP